VVDMERRVVDPVGMEGKVLKVLDVVDADTVGTEGKVVVVVVTAVGMGEGYGKSYGEEGHERFWIWCFLLQVQLFSFRSLFKLIC